MLASIVVPCYNESKNIALILDRFSRVIHRSDLEVILVDNGSSDDTPAVLLALLPQYPFARSIRVAHNQGYGFGILSGLRAARGVFLGWTHADMQTDPFDVIRALELIEKTADPTLVYVKGNRRGRAWLDQFFTLGMAIFETLYLRSVLWDINAQPNLFHRSFFESWINPPYDFSLDLFVLYLAKKKRLHVLRLSVVFPPRLHGQSSWNTDLASKWKFIKRTLAFSRTLKRGFQG